MLISREGEGEGKDRSIVGIIVEEEATGTPAPLIPNDTRRSDVNQTSSRGENCVFPPSRTIVILPPRRNSPNAIVFPSFSLARSVDIETILKAVRHRQRPAICYTRLYIYIRRIKVDETWFRARNRSIFESISLLHISSDLHTRVIVIHWVEESRGR